MDIRDWFQILASPVVLVVVSITIGLVFTRRSLESQLSSQREDHERSRRESAIEIMQFWYVEAYKDPMVHRGLDEFISKISIGQAESILKKEAFEADANDADTYKSILTNYDKNYASKINGTNLCIAKAESIYLRGLIIKMANLQEIVCASYRAHVADRNILEEEFRHILLDDYETELRIARFFKVLPPSTYPSLRKIKSEFPKFFAERPKEKLGL